MPPSAPTSAPTVEDAVHARYSAGARAPEAALCCAVASYDPRLLEAIPEEVIARDYGCGDPTRYVRLGETVVDLGSGSGKACFLMGQIVGPGGRVIGVDMNDAMLELARRHAPDVARRLGYDNVAFVKAKIQDLALDLDAVARHLAAAPVHTLDDWQRLQAETERLRTTAPLVATSSVDVVVSNCVLNLVRPEDKTTLFAEIFRVLRRGGRAVISDIVCDEDVPPALQHDAQLWSGCISGAFREDLFLQAFEDAGFHGIQILERQAQPWQTVEGIEFRSVTVSAYKGKQGECWDRNQAVIYRGPFREVRDDDGHFFRRGERVAVCDKTYHLLGQEPYHGRFDLIAPRVEVPLEEAPAFPCTGGTLRRHPRETKGAEYRATAADESCCPPAADGQSCC
ncbi:MAG: methyltransferase domain-containing protein [Terriglobales bacterium]